MATSIQWIGKPVWWKFGATSQIRSTSRMTRMPSATRRQQRRRASSGCATAAARTAARSARTRSAAPRSPSGPRIRSRYQGISSGRLPPQMIRNCENDEVRPQHDEGEQQLAEVVEVRATSATLAIGSVSASSASTAITNANAVSPWPTMNSSPKIVEYQCGRATSSSRPPRSHGQGVDQQARRATTRALARVCLGTTPASPRSCAADHLFSSNVQNIQMREVDDRPGDEERHVQVAGLLAAGSRRSRPHPARPSGRCFGSRKSSGMKSSTTIGSLRRRGLEDPAPIRPHWPPDRCCSISSASDPIVSPRHSRKPISHDRKN